MIAGTLQALNAGGLDGACFMIRITNASSQSIVISYDGVYDHDVLLDGDILQIDFQTNNRPGNKVALLAKDTVIWIKGTAGAGFIYLSGFYQDSI